MKMMNSETLKEMRSLFNTLPDLGRYLAQIHGFGNGARLKTHPDGRAILFEEKTYNKKKIQNFISILRGFESLLKVPEMFSEFNSKFVRGWTQISPAGSYPELSELIKFFKNAFNHEDALKEGVIAPGKGVDADFDAAVEKDEEITQQSKEYLTEQEKYFNCRISYFGTDKKRFQLEIPESNARKAGGDYRLEGQKKGSKLVRRFHTAETVDEVETLSYKDLMHDTSEYQSCQIKYLNGRILYGSRIVLPTRLSFLAGNLTKSEEIRLNPAKDDRKLGIEDKCVHSIRQYAEKVIHNIPDEENLEDLGDSVGKKKCEE